MYLLLLLIADNCVDPHPANGSKIISPGLLLAEINLNIKDNGFCVG